MPTPSPRRRPELPDDQPLTLADMLAGLANLMRRRPALPVPVEVHLIPAQRQPLVEFAFAVLEDVRGWAAALRFGEPAVRYEEHLGQRVTEASALLGGWTTKLRNIHTGRWGYTA